MSDTMTPDEYEALLEDQAHGCAVCHKPEREALGLAAYRDQTTGKILGLMCGECHVVMAMFENDPAPVEQATAYVLATEPDSDECAYGDGERADGEPR